jgi:hypothetical protein
MNKASRLGSLILDIRYTPCSAIASTIFDFDFGFLRLSPIFAAHTLDLSTLVSVPISRSIQHWEGRSVVYLDSRNDYPPLLGPVGFVFYSRLCTMNV